MTTSLGYHRKKHRSFAMRQVETQGAEDVEVLSATCSELAWLSALKLQPTHCRPTQSLWPDKVVTY